MISSESVRRLIALGAVVAGVAAQSVITSEVGAYKAVTDQRYGVQLFEGKLSVPVPPKHQQIPALLPSAAELHHSAAHLSVVPASASPDLPMLLSEPASLEVSSERYRLRAPYDSPERAVSSGEVIELSENDMLVPLRLP